jgi:hypothetical protein
MFSQNGIEWRDTRGYQIKLVGNNFYEPIFIEYQFQGVN